MDRVILKIFNLICNKVKHLEFDTESVTSGDQQRKLNWFVLNTQDSCQQRLQDRKVQKDLSPLHNGSLMEQAKKPPKEPSKKPTLTPYIP